MNEIRFIQTHAYLKFLAGFLKATTEGTIKQYNFSREQGRHQF